MRVSDKQLNKFIIQVVIFLCIVICLPIMTLYYNTNRNLDTNNSAAIETISSGKDTDYKIDLNGDGRKDILSIEVDDGKYSAIAYINSTKYQLIPSTPLNTLGTSNNEIYCTFIDTTRNNIPEIIIQSYENNTPMQHIFTWNGHKFIDIFSSTNNSIGILDHTSNKTSRLLSFNINSSLENIQQYMYIKDSYKNISYDKSDIQGYSCIQKLIDVIQLQYELEECPDIFNDDVDYYSKSLLWKLSKNTYDYQFRDCFFFDTKCDKNGNPTEYQWNIRFEKKLKSAEQTSSIIKMKVTVKQLSDMFKINSISIEK